MRNHTHARVDRLISHLLAAVGATLVMFAQAQPARAVVYHLDEYLEHVKPGIETTKAIQELIDEISFHDTGAKIVFGPGPYELESNGGSEIISLNNIPNLTLAGFPNGGTKIVITNPHIGFIRAVGCTNLSVSDFSIDYDPLPFTQGIIEQISKDGSHFLLQIDEGFPNLDEPHFRNMPDPATRFGLVMDRKERRVKKGVLDHFFVTEFEELDSHLWKIGVAPGYMSQMTDVSAGDSFVLLSRTVREAGFIVARSRDTSLRDVTFHASPGLAFVPMESEFSELERCNVLFPADSKRLITTNGDGIHAVDNGPGLRIRDCKFEGMADDGINVYSVPARVKQVRAENQVTVAGTIRWQRGQKVQIFEPSAGLLYGEVILTKVYPTENRGETCLEFTPPFHGIGESNLLMNASLSANGLTISGCKFLKNRRHAMYIKSTSALIEGNSIIEPGAFGIVVANEPNWPEGPIPTNIVIRGNKITGGPSSKGYIDLPEGAGIQVLALAANHRPAKGHPISNVQIIANELVDQPAASIFVAAATNVTIEGNIINDTLFAPTSLRQAPVIVEQCANVSIESNSISLGGAIPAAAIEWRTVSRTPEPYIGGNKIQIPADWEIVVGSQDH